MAPAAGRSRRACTERAAGHPAAARRAQASKHSAGRAYATAGRLVNGHAETEFPRFQLKPINLPRCRERAAVGMGFCG